MKSCQLPKCESSYVSFRRNVFCGNDFAVHWRWILNLNVTLPSYFHYHNGLHLPLLLIILRRVDVRHVRHNFHWNFLAIWMPKLHPTINCLSPSLIQSALERRARKSTFCAIADLISSCRIFSFGSFSVNFYSLLFVSPVPDTEANEHFFVKTSPSCPKQVVTCGGITAACGSLG